MQLPKQRRMPWSFVPKPIRTTFLVLFVTLLLLVIAAAAYIWWTGRNTPQVQGVADVPTSTKPALIKPVPTDPNANVGVSVQTLSSPMLAGGEANLIIRTTPQAECTIIVEYNKVKSTAPELVAETADEYGMADWSWYVEDSVPVGVWPVEVTCTHHGKTAMVRGKLEIVESL